MESMQPFVDSIEQWFSPEITNDQLNSPRDLTSGQDIIAHPFPILNYILRPFKFLSFRFNRKLDGNRFSLKVEGGPQPYKAFPISFMKLRKEISNYRFMNLVRSRYFGLLMSRLYIGSYLLGSVEQDFSFGYVRDSLAELIHRKSLRDPLLSVFTGSSYATHEMVRLSSYLTVQQQFERDFIKLYGVPETKRVPFKLFSQGMLPHDAWDE